MQNLAIYLLFACGGFAALAYEVTWMRSFRLVFGSSTQSAAVVLAAYFGGMAVGNLIGIRLARFQRPLRTYGWTEIAIGVTALAVAPWLAAYRATYPSLATWAADAPAVWTTVKFLLATVALAPPTIAMGATFPLVVRAIAPESRNVARATGLLYALNVLGATAGVAVATFALPMAIGIAHTVHLAVAVNIAVGLAAMVLSTSPRSLVEATSVVAPLSSATARSSEPQRAREMPQSSGSLALVALAAASGFGTLALEVLYVRLLSFRSDGSVYSFGLMLMIFLLCLAIGSAVVAGRGDRANLWRWLAVSQIAAAIGILLSPLAFELVTGVVTLWDADAIGLRMAQFMLVALPTLGLPVVLAGLVLPATWKLAASDSGEVHRWVGRLVAANTLAALAGSLVTGFVLLPRIGLAGSLLVVAGLYAVVAAVGFLRGFCGAARFAGIATSLAVPVVGLVVGLDRFLVPAIESGETLVRGRRDGAGATVTVVELPSGHRTLHMNQAYTLGSSASAARELRQGRLPLFLHPHPRRVAMIGVATGISASAVLDFPVERAVAIELVPEVADALGDFARWNRAFYDDPRVELVVDDGRNYLLGSGEQFDVIVSDLFIPWHAGTGDLYTVEHFRTVADHLAEGGLFAQWLPGYQLTDEETRSIVASLAEVFPAVVLWRNDFSTELPLLCVVCYRDAAMLDAAAMAEACRRLGEPSRLPDPFLATPLGSCMLYVANDAELREWAAGAVLNTDDRPYIEYATPASFHRHRQRDATEALTLLGGFRPRCWGYPQNPLGERSIDDALRAGELLHDAHVARAANHFEQEHRLTMELIPLAADVPAVTDYVMRLAARSRSRGVATRSDELLSRLCEQPNAPVVALIALAEDRRGEGKLPDAIDLLSRAVQRYPDVAGLRRSLVAILKQSQQFADMQPHLEYLVAQQPDDAFLILDLAHSFDQQGKNDAAQAQIDRFRTLRVDDSRRNAWRYLRGLGLGKYVDEPSPEGEGPEAPSATAP